MPRTRAADFRPSSGLLTHVACPTDARVETWVESGAEVSPFYDPLIAKIIVHGRHARGGAAQGCAHALDGHRDRRPRNQPRLSAPARRVRSSGRGRGADAHARDVPLQRADDRGAERRARRRRCRIIRPRRLLGRRRAAVRSDGPPVVPPRQSHRRQRRGRCRRSKSRSPARRCEFNCDAVDLPGAAPRWTRRSTARRCRSGSRSPSPPARRLEARQRHRRRLRAPISPCAAASTCRLISAAAPPSRSASSAAMAAARCCRATSCTSERRRPPVASASRAACRQSCCPRSPQRPGRSASSTARTARRTSSPMTTSRRSSPPTGRCTTTPTAPASA